MMLVLFTTVGTTDYEEVDCSCMDSNHCPKVYRTVFFGCCTCCFQSGQGLSYGCRGGNETQELSDDLARARRGFRTVTRSTRGSEEELDDLRHTVRYRAGRCEDNLGYYSRLSLVAACLFGYCNLFYFRLDKKTKLELSFAGHIKHGRGGLMAGSA